MQPYADGVFQATSERLEFVELDPPTDEEVETLCIDIAKRIVKKSDTWDAADEDDEKILLTAAQDECLRLPLPDRPPSEPKKRPRCALVAGFSLDANTFVSKDDRPALERLLRYGTRPAFAQSRLSITESGKVSYRLKRPWYTGQTEIVLAPLAFLKRLTALIPPPRQHQIRFHGLLAPNANRRADLIGLATVDKTDSAPVPEKIMETTPPEPTGSSKTCSRARRIAWAALLKHVFQLDLLVCPECQGKRKIIAAVTKPDAIEKILTHLGLPTQPPRLAPARAPPQMDLDGTGWGYQTDHGWL
jgi:hypothetical protein